jgi:Tfp pilus assembly protein PilX
MSIRLRRQRGYVLAFVLMILLVLSLLVASLYTQSDDFRSANVSAAFAQVAAINAERGAQEGLRAIRAGTVNLSSISGTCTGPNYRADCVPASYIEMAGSTDGGVPIVDNGYTTGPTEGGGLQYSYTVYRSNVLNQPLNRYTIQATGYAGMGLNSQSLVTAVVELEIEVGSGVAFTCVNSYTCI